MFKCVNAVNSTYYMLLVMFKITYFNMLDRQFYTFILIIKYSFPFAYVNLFSTVCFFLHTHTFVSVFSQTRETKTKRERERVIKEKRG